MPHHQPIAAAHLMGVWRWSVDPDHIVVYAERETWSFNVGDIRYAGEPYSVTTWFVERGELVTHEQAMSADDVPVLDPLERRYAIELADDEMTLTDLDLDCVTVFRRERDPALVAELSRPIVRIEPVTRDEPRLGRLRWHARYRSWHGETELAGARMGLLLDGEAEADPRPFERARAAIAQLEAGGLERCLAFASHELLELANDWRQDGDPVLDAAAFRARMVPGTLAIGRPDRISLGFGVGEVFGDHGVEVHLDPACQPVRAEMG